MEEALGLLSPLVMTRVCPPLGLEHPAFIPGRSLEVCQVVAWPAVITG